MIFVGDVAIPKPGAIKLVAPDALRGQCWFGNLEGSLESGDIQQLLTKTVVFNHMDALIDLKQQIDLAGVALANNHITDTQPIQKTIERLTEINVPCLGAGDNLESAKEPLLLDDNGIPVVILNFGWEVVNCPVADKQNSGVNPLLRDDVLTQVANARRTYSSRKLVVYLHWNYELEAYPQPLDRTLAHQLVDLGADAIIGCHAHRPLGIETYKGKPIVYGLGNWLFPQNIFWNGRLKFPDFCKQQLAFEIDWTSGEHKCHWFEYSADQHQVSYISSSPLRTDSLIRELSLFSAISHAEYPNWFKKNRYHKKLLPVFYFEDSTFRTKLKIRWIKLRHSLILKLRGLKA